MKWLHKPQLAKFILNCWPPLLGAGIKLVELNDDFRFARVRLKLRFWNKNANHSQFGGSIFAMTDPFYPLLLMGILGKEYYIWDKLADIDFIKPGCSDLYADFVISEEKIMAILEATKGGQKTFPEFVVNIVDEQGVVVARVRRILYVRKKPIYR